MEGMGSRAKGIIAATVVAVVLLGAGVWYFYLRDDAPEEVSLEAATEQVTSTSDGFKSSGLTATTRTLEIIWVTRDSGSSA